MQGTNPKPIGVAKAASRGAAVLTFDDLAASIARDFTRLTPQFQVVARFILDHPDEVAVSSMRALAARSRGARRRSTRMPGCA